MSITLEEFTQIDFWRRCSVRDYYRCLTRNPPHSLLDKASERVRERLPRSNVCPRERSSKIEPIRSSPSFPLFKSRRQCLVVNQDYSLGRVHAQRASFRLDRFCKKKKSCTDSPPRRNNQYWVRWSLVSYMCIYARPRSRVIRVISLIKEVPRAEHRNRLSRTRATRAAAASGLWTGWYQSTRSVLYLRISHSGERASALVLARSLVPRRVDSTHGQFHHG